MTFTKVCDMHVANLAQTSTIDGALELSHRRLGHLNIKGVHALQNMVSGMNLGNMPCPTSSFVCEGCIEGKLLEITWKQARNESFKVHEMEQLY